MAVQGKSLPTISPPLDTGRDFQNPPANLGADVNIVRPDDIGDDEFAAVAEDVAQRITGAGKNQHADDEWN